MNRDDESRCDPSFHVWEYDSFLVIPIKPGLIAIFLVILINQDESRCDPSFPVLEYDSFLVILINQDESRCDPSFPVWEYDNFLVILIKPGLIAIFLVILINQDESRFFLFRNMTTSLSFSSNQDESRCDPSFPVWEYDSFLVILIKPG
ncbi:hypothetical protein YC2023_033219 [Brassica napus]